jgi:hypothetical protein
MWLETAGISAAAAALLRTNPGSRACARTRTRARTRARPSACARAGTDGDHPRSNSGTKRLECSDGDPGCDEERRRNVFVHASGRATDGRALPADVILRVIACAPARA